MLKKIRRKIRRKGKALSRKSKVFDKIYGTIVRKRREARYNRYARLPIEEKTIIFDTFNGRRCGDSPRAIYDYMVQNPEFSDYNFIWLLRSVAKKEFAYLADMPATSIVTWGTDEFYKAYATAKYWIVNARVPAIIKRRDEQVYVQCWHGTPVRELFCDIKTDDIKQMEKNRRIISEDSIRYSYMISPSRFYSDIVRSAFNLTGQGKDDVVIETGYPRNDAMTNRAGDREKLREALGIPRNKKAILYAPTYREDMKKAGSGYNYNDTIDFDALLEHISEDHIVIFRAHYFITDKLDFEKFGDRIIDASMYPDINDLIIASDMLITDYSSVFFDYCTSKRPVIFYMTDLEFKKELRAFYIDLNELPGPITKTQAELEDAINSLEQWTSTDEYREKYRKFNDKFTYLDDGKATKRVVEAVFGKS